MNGEPLKILAQMVGALLVLAAVIGFVQHVRLYRPSHERARFEAAEQYSSELEDCSRDNEHAQRASAVNAAMRDVAEGGDPV